MSGSRRCEHDRRAGDDGDGGEVLRTPWASGLGAGGDSAATIFLSED